MTNKKKNAIQPLPAMPKWLIPFVVIILAGLVFFTAQFAANLILSLYALGRGWTANYANTWLAQSITAQFVFVVLAESFTVGLIYLILRHYGKSLSRIGLSKRIKPVWFLYSLLAYPFYLVIYLVLFLIIAHISCRIIFFIFSITLSPNGKYA